MTDTIDPLDLSRALIRCPSVTPEDAGALDVLEDALEGLGFSCHRLTFSEAGTADVDNLYARIGGVEQGYWYDLTATPPGYREEGTGTVVSTSALLARIQGIDDVVIGHGVPVGSGPRIAALDGRPATPNGPAPTTITLEPMRPSSAWVDVPLLTKNWNIGTGPNDFNWDGEISPGVPAAEPISLKAIRIFQDALINKAPSSDSVPSATIPRGASASPATTSGRSRSWC